MQVVSEVSQISNQNQHQSSQTEQNLLKSDGHYDYELSASGQVLRLDHLVDAHITPNQEPGSVIITSSEEAQVVLLVYYRCSCFHVITLRLCYKTYQTLLYQVIESNGKGHLVAQQPQQNLQESSSQFHDAARVEPLPEQKSETKVCFFCFRILCINVNHDPSHLPEKGKMLCYLTWSVL